MTANIHGPAGAERRLRLKRQILFSLFVALILLLSFTPLGFIQLLFIKATSVHIPVIVGSLILGPYYGLALGGVFGLASLVNNSLNPSLLSFCFSPLIPLPGSGGGSPLALLVVFLPRLLCGFIPGLIFRSLNARRLRRGRGEWSRGALLAQGGWLAALGSLLNTIPVMGLIYLFFAPELAALKGIGGEAVLAFVLGVVFTNGLPELLVAALFTGLALPVLHKQFN